MDIWAFVRKTRELRVVAFNYSTLGERIWPYAVRPSNVCAKRFVGVPWGSTWNRLHKTKKIKGFFLRRPRTIIVLRLLWLVGHVFAASASPRFGTKKVAMSPLPLLFMAFMMIPNMLHSSCYCVRHSWLTQFGVFSLNQPVPV